MEMYKSVGDKVGTVSYADVRLELCTYNTIVSITQALYCYPFFYTIPISNPKILLFSGSV